MSDAPTRVLLIEDNPDDACFLQEALSETREERIELVHVEHLNDAAKRLSQETFQVILLDLSLPDSQGIETVLRVQDQAPSVPIIVLTGLNDDNIALQAVRAGAQDYLVKGDIDARILVRSIRYASERKQAYEEMARLAADLARANKVKDDFLSVISHELRTPLIAIMGYAQLLEEDFSSEATSEHAKAACVIRQKSDELLRMIRRILEVVKIETGQVRIVPDIVDLTEFMKDLSKSIVVAVKKNVAIEWEYPAQLPKIVTDATKLNQILQNIIDNAIKFTDQGQVTIAVRDVPERGLVEFKVRDSGVGISREVLPVIFDKFRQADSSDKRHHEGIGLGLYIAKKFAESLDGKITVESHLGTGSEFTVTIFKRLPANGDAPHPKDPRDTNSNTTRNWSNAQ
ncbi:MAG TPA: hybrid sensor histidine kinase/response regulator [Candidatus Binatia bacterium]